MPLRVTIVTQDGPLFEEAGADFFVGLPEAEEHRVARLIPPRSSLKDLLKPLGDSLLLARVFSNPGDLFDYDEMWNTRQLHAAELPSSNGIGTCRPSALTVVWTTIGTAWTIGEMSVIQTSISASSGKAIRSR